MAKKIVDYVKLQISAGQATPAPPVGSALGPKGINIMDFCKQFNSKTSNQPGMIIPVVITIYSDKSFTFITKTPPASILILKAIKLEKGSKESNRIVAGKISSQQIEEIAKIKMPDLNCDTLASAASMVRGTARSMGIKVE